MCPSTASRCGRRVLRCWVVDIYGSPARALLRLELLPHNLEARVGESQEDETEDGLGALGGGEPAVGAKLVGRIPELLFEALRVLIYRPQGDPLQGR